MGRRGITPPILTSALDQLHAPVALTAADEYDIEYMMQKISETYNRAGLKVNFAETRYLVVGLKFK
jgi:hypothetical protein